MVKFVKRVVLNCDKCLEKENINQASIGDWEEKDHGFIGTTRPRPEKERFTCERGTDLFN